MLTLAEAKTQLSLTTTAHDIELQDFVDSVPTIVENRVGKVLPVAVVEWPEPTRGAVLFLRKRLATITSVTGYQGATALAFTQAADPTAGGAQTYLLEQDLRRLTRIGSSGNDMSWCSMRVKLAYTAGFTVIPEPIQVAARIILQELWKTRRGAKPIDGAVRATRAGAPSESTPGIPPGFKIPHQAELLLAPYSPAPWVG